MDDKANEVKQQVKDFKRESLKKTETQVKNHPPSQKGMYFKFHLASVNEETKHFDVKSTKYFYHGKVGKCGGTTAFLSLCRFMNVDLFYFFVICLRNKTKNLMLTTCFPIFSYTFQQTLTTKRQPWRRGSRSGTPAMYPSFPSCSVTCPPSKRESGHLVWICSLCYQLSKKCCKNALLGILMSSELQ